MVMVSNIRTGGWSPLGVENVTHATQVAHVKRIIGITDTVFVVASM